MKKPLPPPPSSSTFSFLVPSDHAPLLKPVSHSILINTGWAYFNGVERTIINNSTYLTQLVLSLYTATTTPARYFFNPLIYGHVNPFVP